MFILGFLDSTCGPKRAARNRKYSRKPREAATIRAMSLRAFVQVVVLVAVTVLSPHAFGAGKTAFIGVNVVPMDKDQVLPAQVVVVEGDRIVSIGPASIAKVPEGAVRIDGKGRYLMPALADMHIHIPPEGSDEASATKEFWLFVANGVTTARVMIGQPEHLALRDKIARGELFGPKLYVAGPPVGLDPKALPGVPELKTLDDARRVGPDQKKAGYDYLKVLDDLTLEQYDAIVAGARTAGLPVVGHVPDAVDLTHALESQLSIEHLGGYIEAMIPAADRHKPDLRLRDVLDTLETARLPELVAATVKAGTWNCPTLDFWAMLFGADTPEELGKRAGLQYVPKAKREEWAAQRQKQLARPNAAGSDFYARYHGLRARIAKALSDAGAPLLLGTDSPDFYNVAGFAIHEELGRLVAAGLTPYQALRGGTSQAAVFLHQEKEFGTVAVGLRADLILADANPLADVATLRKPAGVMLRGRWIPRSEIDAKLAELAADAAK
jgi:imidazolonepropionase-like amidohydrolase